MRKAFVCIFTLALAACSLSDEQKAEKLITKYLERNANDPSSVEIIEIHPFEVDSASSYKGTLYYSYLTKDIEAAKASIEENKDIKELADMYRNELKESEQKLEDYQKEFKPFFYWRTLVEYRAKNAMGALVKKTAKVRMDKELTKIIDFKDTDE